MWASMLHMVFGNALIGVFEGAFLAWIAGISKKRTIPIMILANYFSAWIGAVGLGFLTDHLDLDINNYRERFLVAIVASYFATLVLEFPFVWWCLRGVKERLRKSGRGVILVNAASYLLLLGWYLLVSPVNLRAFKVVASEELSLPRQTVVYYLEDHDAGIYQRAWNDAKPVQL